MLTPTGYFDLLETFPKRGCAVCILTWRDVDRFLDAILYEHTTDPRMHARFRASRGLCNIHGQQMIRAGSALGIATLYEAVVDELLAQLSANAPQRGLSRLRPSQNNPLADALSPAQPCIACEEQADIERRYTQTIATHITDEKLQTAYQQSDGLCLNHFRMTLKHAPNGDNGRLLARIQANIWGKLRGELSEFRRKYDFQHVDEAMGAEGDSWKRAVRIVGGE